MNLEKFKKEFEYETVKLMRDAKVPGMSIFITKDGEPIYQRAFGLRKKKDVKPATIDTLYGISSITKSVTSMAIMQLYEAGKLDIHSPISDYLPVDIGFKDTPITSHHLMSHSSGVPALHTFYFAQMNQELYPGKTPMLPLGNWDDFYFHINEAKDEVISPPGTKFYYWNGAFVLLSQIVAKISGKPYEEYVKEKILDPLDMKRSTYSNREAEKDGNDSRGFNFIWQDNQIKRYSQDLLTSEFTAGSGGLISSAVEMTNYLQCFLNNGEFNGKKILREDLIKEMYKPHNPNIKSSYHEYCPGATLSYGYGLRVYENYHGYTMIAHGGVSGVTGGQIAFIPELDITFVQLYNVSFLPKLLKHTACTLLLGKNPKEDMPYYIRSKHYKALCGRYEAFKKILTIDVKERNGLLYLEGDFWDGRLLHPIFPKNGDPDVLEFYSIAPYGKMDVPFTKHDNGEITFEYERYVMHKKTTEVAED
ncbi:MAG: serine hydrolase domain-containing protein [Candidatus Heimdallarchaeaceae archaeon]|jgi:CubicO group peptidase (beta-lactamase class C family)